MKLNFNLPFKLFENCLITKGYLRSTIVDTQRGNYYLVPNSLCEIINEYDGKTITFLLKSFGEKDRVVILNYFEFLLKNELIFFTKTPKLFPKIKLTSWENSSDFYQAIIDIEGEMYPQSTQLFKSLDDIGIKYVDIRIFGKTNLRLLCEMLKYFNDSSIVGINIYINYNSIFSLRNLKEKLKFFLRINNIYVYSAPMDKFAVKMQNGSFQNIFLIKNHIKSSLDCGVVSKEYFTINLDNFTKSNNCNSCLSGKIGIDIDGNIKNCPSLKKSFGNIKTVKIEDVIKNRSFKSYWNITKDKIKVCKDCEFRNICTDCRAYIEEPEDIYSKPLKCGYNPYTGLWEDWFKNADKLKAIDHYQMKI